MNACKMVLLSVHQVSLAIVFKHLFDMHSLTHPGTLRTQTHTLDSQRFLTSLAANSKNNVPQTDAEVDYMQHCRARVRCRMCCHLEPEQTNTQQSSRQKIVCRNLS